MCISLATDETGDSNGLSYRLGKVVKEGTINKEFQFCKMDNADNKHCCFSHSRISS